MSASTRRAPWCPNHHDLSTPQGRPIAPHPRRKDRQPPARRTRPLLPGCQAASLARCSWPEGRPRSRQTRCTPPPLPSHHLRAALVKHSRPRGGVQRQESSTPLHARVPNQRPSRPAETARRARRLPSDGMVR
ncbi:hypothetical protein BU16DRAFT_306650 [Lophium mytilinum]|uniref:Uncharacterized protein n=1 Tax=Lophium mytilinum TaxID=390894 RepID=A0A6A6R2B3_9PEZI|nr:hypothetical protein BU16DRAFT_306650 [Lophium mytilinum]